MISLNLPNFDIKLRQREDGQTEIFDFLRQRYIRLTPEEWVRQHFTHFLIEHKHYPAGLLGNEISLSVNGVIRRCDSVLFKREGGSPLLIIEYKAPNVRITQKVFTQISSYNSVLHANYLIVSNGLNHYICRMDYTDLSMHFLSDIPDYTELIP